MGWSNLLMCHQEFCLHYGPYHKILVQKRGVWMDYQMLGRVGGHKIMVFGCTNFNCTQVGHGVPHPHKCVKFGSWGYASSKSYWKMWFTYASRFLNNVEKNYTTIERETLTMVDVLHKFRHYLLRIFFYFYVALLYLVKKPQLSRWITRWLLLFLEYKFSIVYKPRHSDFLAISWCYWISGGAWQNYWYTPFIFQLEWLQEVHTYISIENFPKGYSIKQWKKLVLKALYHH
jgi:hypothetical protein